MCTTRSKPSTKQKKNETTPSIRLRAVELCQLLTIISIESIHSPRIYQVFLFPSQDKYVNTNEYDGSREELWGKPKILYRDFCFIFFFILAWTARLKIYDRYDENIFFFVFRWDKNTDPHATCKLNSMRTPIKSQALPFWFVCFLKRNDNPVQQDKICWGKAHNLNGNKRTKGKKMRERLCIPLL